MLSVDVILMEEFNMSDKGLFGSLGKVFSNDILLWFIILFLLLFWCWGGFGFDKRYDDTLE